MTYLRTELQRPSALLAALEGKRGAALRRPAVGDVGWLVIDHVLWDELGMFLRNAPGMYARLSRKLPVIIGLATFALTGDVMETAAFILALAQADANQRARAVGYGKDYRITAAYKVSVRASAGGHTVVQDLGLTGYSWEAAASCS